jgi:hypothetical protein
MYCDILPPSENFSPPLYTWGKKGAEGSVGAGVCGEQG